ncbi:MAG: N-acetylmuramoyl-L-alanine amidase, partial [Abditibacteriota bacterium]|nr:N-acetylmuramoyl-L-alanine amidase [Abditibacteriota bacterium]
QYITREDFHTLDLSNILITYLEQEGATIIHCREGNKDRGNCSYSGKPWWQMSPIAYMADQGYPSNLYGGSAYADVSQSRYAASNLANYRGADLYLSIHTNALSGDCYSNCGTGLEAFWSSNHSSSGSQRLAQLCLDNCITFVRDYYDSSFYCRRNCAAVDAGYAETRVATMPSTLFEFAFHDNCAKDAKYLGDNFFRTVGMYAVAKGVYDYYGITPKYGPYSAEYISDTIPSNVSPGETRQVSVTFKNHGFCWQSSRDFKLGVVAGNSLGAAARQTLPAETMPGSTVTFTFNMTFPSAAGTYNTQWQMMRENVGWFGDVVNKTVVVGTPEYGAQAVSNTIPSTVGLGGTRSVSVTMKNTGSKTWTVGSGIRLASVGDDDPFAAKRHDITSNVAPGANYTFTFDMNFPTGGTFTTDWQMIRENVGGFGDIVTKNVTVSDSSVYNAQCTANTIPTSVTAGSSQSVSVTMKNTGNTTWVKGSGVRLSATNDYSPFAGKRYDIDSNVAPGSGYTFTFTMNFPTAGTYTTGWQMIRENVDRFGDVTSKTVTVNDAAYNAQCTGNTIPGTGAVGETRSVSVTMKNTGNATWVKGSGIRLSATNDYSPFAAKRYDITSDVAPGASYTFTFNMTFSEAGTYTTGWQMIRENVERFGGVLNKNVTVTAPPANLARYVSDTIPSTVVVGETRTVSITMKNVGTSTWTSGDNYKLGAIDNTDPFSSAGRRYLSADVAPGQTVTFTVNMTFSEVGTFTTDWQMLQEGVGWFGDVLAKNVTVVAQNYNAQCTGNTIPSSVTEGASQSVSITMKNTGNVTWVPGSGVRLAATDDNSPFAAKRYDINKNVAPGESYTFTFTMNFSAAGTYTTGWQMIRENVEQFGGVLNKTVTVNPKPERDAQYVSDTIPSTVAAGETRQISITFRNTGSAAWVPGSGIRLSALDDDDSFAAKRYDITSTVNPGQSYTFTFTMTFPNVGTYSTDWQMICENVERFGDTLVKNVTVTVPERKATYVSDTIPSTATLGTSASVSVTFKNTGTATWKSSEGYRLQAVGDSDPFAGKRYDLTSDVAPGQSYTFTFTMNFNRLGTSTTDWQMIKENVEQFGDIAAKDVTVTRPAGAKEFYVNFNQGNDANSGLTPNTPWKTFDNVNLNAEAGDTIYICGTSTGTVTLNGKSGTASAPITIRPYYSTYNTTYQGCTINTSGTYCMEITGCNYIVVDGARKDDNLFGYIEWKNARRGVYINASNNCVFKNLNIHDINPNNQGDGTAFWIRYACNNNKIIRNLIRNVGTTT